MNSVHLKIEAFQQSEIEALNEHKDKNGKVVALFNRYFPLSLLWGLNIRPIRIVSGTNLIAENASEQLIRPDACPFCKSIIGNFLLKNSLHKHADLIVGVITCDQMKRTMERVEVDCGIPVFPVQMPATASELASDYYIESVMSTIENIGVYLDSVIDMSEIRRAEKYQYKAALILYRLFTDCNVHPETIHIIASLFAWTRPKEFYYFLRDIIEDLPAFKAKKCVIVIGSIIGKEDTNLITLLAESGCFPILLTSTMVNAVEGLHDTATVTDKNLIRTIIKNTFNLPKAIRARPNTSVYNRIEYYIRTFNPSGLIMKSLVNCDLWYTEKRRIMDSFSLPVLVLNTGYGEGTEGSINTRIEAFLEIMQ